MSERPATAEENLKRARVLIGTNAPINYLGVFAMHKEFHALWSASVGQADYDKSKWTVLDALFSDTMHAKFGAGWFVGAQDADKRHQATQVIATCDRCSEPLTSANSSRLQDRVTLVHVNCKGEFAERARTAVNRAIEDAVKLASERWRGEREKLIAERDSFRDMMKIADGTDQRLADRIKQVEKERDDLRDEIRRRLEEAKIVNSGLVEADSLVGSIQSTIKRHSTELESVSKLLREASAGRGLSHDCPRDADCEAQSVVEEIKKMLTDGATTAFYISSPYGEVDVHAAIRDFARKLRDRIAELEK